MPCNLLPILGNNAGDWLCLKFANDNSVGEVVHWYHGGGDLISWGNSLSEAIVFDAFTDRLPGPVRQHSLHPIPRQRGSIAKDRFVHWALGFVPDGFGNWAKSHVLSKTNAFDERELATELLEHGISSTAVLCQLVIATLPVQFFESNDLDSIIRSKAQENSWSIVTEHCLQTTEIAPSAAWAWDLLGLSREIAGNSKDAIAAYQNGARCSIFTDQSVRVGTSRYVGSDSKFSVRRLRELDPNTDQDLYLRLLKDSLDNPSRSAVTRYWLALSNAHAQDGDPSQAADAAFQAGWDIGADPIATYEMILGEVEKRSKDAGRTALAELAKTHLSCFCDRYKS